MSKTFRAFVASYLASGAGRDTPDSVARALLALDATMCGFDLHPSAGRLHEFRLLIQEVHAAAPQSDLAAGMDADSTGVWMLTAAVRTKVG